MTRPAFFPRISHVYTSLCAAAVGAAAVLLLVKVWALWQTFP